ncbi:hypothetical protein ACIQMY_26315 [Streptomyces sp. NPDC091368]|uniref:hypothetical protein n=1 Tax=Streptomyces sp. NPDC091368 TaxID=3365993 RepID=UPI003817EF57
MTRTENEADQIVFRWDSENLTGSTGFGPVAWSGPRDEAENLFRVSGPVLRASGDETRPALIRLQQRAGVMLIRRLPFTDAGGGTSVLCHALVGSPALLDPAVCLGLHAWTWEGAAAADLAGARGRLPVVPEEVLVPATGRGQGELDGALARVSEELVGAVAELLRHPDDRFTVLDERGDTACPVLWGLHSMFGALIDRRWTFATHDTLELPALRFAFVGRWSGAASRNTERRRVDPRERCGDRAEDVADRLVRHHLRGIAEADGDEYAVGRALHAAASARRGTLLETASRAADALATTSRPAAPPRPRAEVPPRSEVPARPEAPPARPNRPPRAPQTSQAPHASHPPRPVSEQGQRDVREPRDPRDARDAWDLRDNPDTRDPRDPVHGDTPSPGGRDTPDPWYDETADPRYREAPDPWFEEVPDDRAGTPRDLDRRRDAPDPWYDEPSAAGRPTTPKPVPAPTPRSEPAPTPRSEPVPAPRTEPESAPVPPPAPRTEPESSSVPPPAPRTEPESAPVPPPTPESSSAPAPTTHTEPAPEPAPAPPSVPPAPEVPPRAPLVEVHPRPVLPSVGPQWTGPGKGARRVRVRREREAETSLVHKLPDVRSVEEARELVRRAGSRELLDALRKPQAYAVVTVLLAEIAGRLPSWDHPLHRELCDVAIDRELWAVVPPTARDDPSEPAAEQRAANSAELHRWVVRPLLGGGDAPVGRFAELLSRLRTSPDPSAREAFWLIVEGERPGLPESVWRTLLKEAYGLSRSARRPGIRGPAPAPPDDFGTGYTRRFLSRVGLLLGGLVALIVLIAVVQGLT